jgi:hypothetical protein
MYQVFAFDNSWIIDAKTKCCLSSTFTSARKKSSATKVVGSVLIKNSSDIGSCDLVVLTSADICWLPLLSFQAWTRQVVVRCYCGLVRLKPGVFSGVGPCNQPVSCSFGRRFRFLRPHFPFSGKK